MIIITIFLVILVVAVVGIDSPATQFELFDDVTDLLESVVISMVFTRAVRDNQECCSVDNETR